MAIEGVSGTGLEAQSSQTDAVKSLIRWESPHPLSIAGVSIIIPRLYRPRMTIMRMTMKRKLDRLARSMKQLIETIEELRLRGIGFRSLTEALDTTTAQGRLVFHMFGALAEFERSLIRSAPKRVWPPRGGSAAPEAVRRN